MAAFAIPLQYTYWLGMLVVYLGERVIGTGWPRVAITAIGLFLILVGLTGRYLRLRMSAGIAQEQAAEQIQIVLYLVGFAAVLLYFAGGFLRSRSPGSAPAAWLDVVWPIVWLAAFVPQLMIKFAYAVVPNTPVEPGKLRTATLAGLRLALGLTLAVAAIYLSADWTTALALGSPGAGATFTPPPRLLQAIYFFATVMIVPGVILLLGWVYTRFHGRPAIAQELDPMLKLGDPDPPSRSDTAP